MNSPHISVMEKEVLHFFEDKKIKVFFEGTVGAGGHAKAILEAHPEIESYLACDRDPQALKLAQANLQPWKDKVELIHGNFADLDLFLKRAWDAKNRWFFFDFGVSSMQLDQGEKGFSFVNQGPLDMRMDPTTSLTAEEVVNRWTEKKLGELFRDLGEDPRWRRAAKAIVEARRLAPIRSTTDLAEILSHALGSKIRGKLHPATLVFQALRICVNDELNSIKEGLTKAMMHLAPAGRIGVISFHRLEDRIVKNLFKVASLSKNQWHLVNKKPLEPTSYEIRKNARCRSAKMRFLECKEEDV